MASDLENTIYMDLPNGRVIIELAPGFAPEHVANIKTMAKGGFWDGLNIYRSQDNFVVQFGDPDGEEAGKAVPALQRSVRRADPARRRVARIAARFTRSDGRASARPRSRRGFHSRNRDGAPCRGGAAGEA